MTARKQFWVRAGQRLGFTPRLALFLALALLSAAISLAIRAERISRDEKLHDVMVQAQILAGSVAAPLAFDDRTAAQEYVDALKVNPDILSAAAYDESDRRVAGFARSGTVVPTVIHAGPPRFHNEELIVTVPVTQNGTRLGAVYLHAALERWTRRLLRYAGIGIVITMASLLVAVLGTSYASVAEAHRRLKEETEQRAKMEEALRQSQKMEAMGQLTGGVAHDFNNLLMVASSGMELLDRTEDPAKRERLKDAIRQAIARGAKLTQQLLTFARRTPMNPQVIALPSRIRGLQELLDRSLREDIAVEIDLPHDLWPVEVDPSQLEVALLNITVNARDAMPQGGTIRIAGSNEPATTEGASDMVRLAIVDQGSGMPPDLLEKVFEPFFTTKGVGQGTGLGLSQVHGFAHASGGTVEIDSEVGRGTTISMLLPRSHAVLPCEPGKVDDDDARAARRCHVLLAEDDDAVAELVTQMLDELGYDSSRVSDARTALTRVQSGDQIDLVLSDMVMPGDIFGLDLARAIRQRSPAPPIILMTGYSDAASAATAEGFELLLKPYTLEALGKALRAAMEMPAEETRRT